MDIKSKKSGKLPEQSRSGLMHIERRVSSGIRLFYWVGFSIISENKQMHSLFPNIDEQTDAKEAKIESIWYPRR